MPTRATLKTLAILQPNRPTAVAVTPTGKVYFVQATDDGRDLLLTLGPRELPEPTALTSSRVAEELGDPTMVGNFQALCADRDGRLWFYFVGRPTASRRAPAYAVGLYDPLTTRLRLYAGTRELLAATRMGAAIELVDVDLVATDTRLWLWLRHIDAGELLAIDLTRLPSQGPAGLIRPVVRVACGDETLPMTQTRPPGRLSPASRTGDDLLFVEPHTGGLFRIDPVGRATLLSTLIGLPGALSPAATIEPAPGDPPRYLLAAGDADPIEPKVESRLDAAPFDTHFPALLVFEPGQRGAAIPHQKISARPGLPVYALRLQTLCPDATPHAFVTYDAASGELMRLTLKY